MEKTITLKMGDALRSDQFVMVLQPKCDMRTGDVIGSEALVRWKDPRRGVIPPGEFLPIMEKNGFISRIDSFILEQACLCQRRWLDEGGSALPISVNLSRVDLYNPQLVADIVATVDAQKLPHDLIEFELTESSFVFDNSKMALLSRELRNRGFRVLMDDFGSGYSSLNTLKDIDVNVVKMDLEFLQNSEHNEKALIILEAVVRMTKAIKVDIIVEGVETAGQAEFLRSIGVRKAQGFYYYRPMSVDDFEKLVKK